MESEEIETPEMLDEAGTDAGLEASLGSEERSRRVRRWAVRVDSHSSLLKVTRRLRRELPGDEQFGDPLSTAGRQPVEVLGRTVSGLQSDRKSVLQELGFAGLQVWQSLSEAAGRGRGTQEMAVMFTDLAGFSSWALKAGDEPALALLRDVGTRVEAVIAQHEGRIVKRLGDGVMATFLSAQAAVEAALDAQAEMDEIEIDGYRPSMRVGVHWGSPRKLGGDYLGVDVNIAARVGDAARPGQVLISDALLTRIDTDGLRVSRPKRLRASGAPRDLHVARVSRD
jgi:adenylate cyclase